MFYFNLISQLTGRILDPFWEKPKTLNIPDIEAFPLLDSSARSPKFQHRYTVKTPHGGITGEAMLLLRIYTLDVNSGELIVFGNSVIRVFIEKENDEVHTLNFELMLIIVPGNVIRNPAVPDTNIVISFRCGIVFETGEFLNILNKQ